MAKKKKSERRRRETRFFPQSNANPIVIRVIGALGAALLGAGAFEQFWASQEPWKYTPYLLASGALAIALSIWFGTSGDLILRVGDGGVGADRGDVRRIPWYQVTEIFFDPQLKSISVKGKDEAGADFRIDAKLKSQAQAAAWIVKEGKTRIPKWVDVSAEGEKELPDALPSTDIMLLEDLQVVGRKDAVTGKAIAYEPDARVCKRCERVYYKSSVPKRCACGASLLELRNQADRSDDDDDDEEYGDVAEESVDENVVASVSKDVSKDVSTDDTAESTESASDEETT